MIHDPVAALTHLSWAILCIPAWICLIYHRQNKITLSIFMASALACYSSSFLYHGISREFLVCDHVSIFLLIAGSYTPIVWQCCEKRIRILFIIWALAFTGIALRILTGYIYDVVYIAFGWGIILASYDLLKYVFRKEMLLILVGAMFYTVGAVLEVFQVPSIIPGWVEHHEVFHMFVMAGTASHYLFMYRSIK